MATSEEAIQATRQVADPAIYQEAQKRRLWQIIGASKFANRLATSLSAQGVHGAELIRDDKLWAAEAGYDSFRDFLDHHPESPMSYHQFDQRSKLLKSEGDLLFDLLSSLDVPMTARALLKGQIEVEGNELRVGDLRVRRDDEAAILNLITTQYAKLQEQERTLERTRKDYDKEKRLRIETERRAASNGIDGSPLARSMMLLATAFREVEEALDAADVEEKQASQNGLFDLMSNGQLRCSAKLGLVSADEIKRQKSSGADPAEIGDDLGD